MRRVALQIRGIVQGVGFRPRVYALAERHGLTGWVLNSAEGVRIEVEGPDSAVTAFIETLRGTPPPHARVTSFETTEQEPLGDASFEIRHSEGSGSAGALVLPDLATCDDCRTEIFDPEDRRHRYPFTNCTNCGPRFSIIEALPYDRATTTMKTFEMCERCRAEYEDPSDRRFHAQPNACPKCGPRLTLRGTDGVVATGDEALQKCAQAIDDGRVVAVKGLGGFHLVVDATNDDAVRRLRERKRRPRKPFAVMFPDLGQVETRCEVGDGERDVLTSARAPIVLLRPRTGTEPRLTTRGQSPAPRWSPAVAPENPYIGAFLPYTPLHLLLLRDLARPVVATSGNLSDEPICTDGDEATERLAGIADLFLDHDRPIRRPVEDSVAFVFRGEEVVVRRGRGAAPGPVASVGSPPGVTAVGGDLKSATALLHDGHLILGPHVGDLVDLRSQDAFRAQLRDLPDLYDADVDVVACDKHPDYHSTRIAGEFGEVLPVQHHHAHVAGVIAEHELAGPVLGVAWDGTGWGPDGTIWGGEFLVVNGAEFERVAHLRPFELPGGDVAAREPRRSALALLHALGLPPDSVRALFDDEELDVLQSMLDRGVRTHTTTSAGRLFDGVSVLLGVGPSKVSYEAEAAMALEFAAMRGERDSTASPMGCDGGTLDWGPFVLDLLGGAYTPGDAALAFHRALAEGIATVVRTVGLEQVALVGGCFQNRLLLRLTVEALEAAGAKPYWSRQIPPGDGGLAAGQAWVAAHRLLPGADD